MSEAARAARAARDAYVRHTLAPYFESRFDELGLRSALLLVAQYWADEADDAVHCEIIWSKLETPDLEAGLEALDDHDEGRDMVNLDGRPQGEMTFDNIRDAVIPGRDDNFDMIPLFAQYCKEDCHQEMLISEAYAPCLLFRRTDDGVTGEIVGDNRRPWLEGVRPEYADDDAPGDVPPSPRLPQARVTARAGRTAAVTAVACVLLAALVTALLRACNDL